jgi:hypothetical protein
MSSSECSRESRRPTNGFVAYLCVTCAAAIRGGFAAPPHIDCRTRSCGCITTLTEPTRGRSATPANPSFLNRIHFLVASSVFRASTTPHIHSREVASAARAGTMSYTQQLFDSLRRMDTPSSVPGSASSVAAALFTTPGGYGSSVPTPSFGAPNPYAQHGRHVTFASEEPGQRWGESSTYGDASFVHGAGAGAAAHGLRPPSTPHPSAAGTAGPGGFGWPQPHGLPPSSASARGGFGVGAEYGAGADPAFSGAMPTSLSDCYAVISSQRALLSQMRGRVGDLEAQIAKVGAERGKQGKGKKGVHTR